MTAAETPASLPRPTSLTGAGAGTASRTGTAARLEHLPVAVFAIVMGLAGTAVAWQRAAPGSRPVTATGNGLAWLALGVFVAAGTGYAVKAWRCRSAVLVEWRHPGQVAFVPTGSIAAVILAFALDEVAPPPEPASVRGAVLGLGVPARRGGLRPAVSRPGRPR